MQYRDPRNSQQQDAEENNTMRSFTIFWATLHLASYSLKGSVKKYGNEYKIIAGKLK
jgi:hypothetical protein